MTILNRAETSPFTTADGSTVRKFLNPRNCELKNEGLAEAILSPGKAQRRKAPARRADVRDRH